MQSQYYRTSAENTTNKTRSLSDKHRREIIEGSGVAPELADGRYFSVTAQEALELGFAENQASDGWVCELISPWGEVSYLLKRKVPRVNKKTGKPIKYEARAGYGGMIDIGPRYDRVMFPGHYGKRGLDRIGLEPLWVVEGPKKGDCIAARGRLPIVLSGVWNWGKKRERGGFKYGRPELIDDWERIPLDGRTVYVCFDEDYRRKRNVALAMLRLAQRLTERGAIVYIVSLPGPEKGIDDFIVAGGDLDELEASARPFTASNLIHYAAKEDRRIRGGVAASQAAMNADQWAANEATAHSLLRSLQELMLLMGRYNPETGEVEATIPTRDLQQYAAIGSRKTLGKHTDKLEERGYIAKVAGDRSKGRANRYILKFSKCDPLIEERGVFLTPGSHLENLEDFAPHLRWPSPTSVSVKGDERDSKLPPPDATPENFPHEQPDIPTIHASAQAGAKPRAFTEIEVSLGKVVEMALHILNVWGGSGTLRDLSEATGVNDTSKLRRKLACLEDVVGMDAKGKHCARVWLEDGWEARLDERRERSGEFRRARRQAVRHHHDTEVFRGRFGDDTPADPEPELLGPERVAQIVEEMRRREREANAERVEREQREADEFVAKHTQGEDPVRFGLLVEMWVEDHRVSERRAKWVLCQALGRLRCSLKAHAEIPGELFVYPEGDASSYAGPNERLWRERQAKRHSQKQRASQNEPYAAAAPKPKMPPKRDGVFVHGALCDCEWCDGEPVTPRYVKLSEAGSA